jgi:hypothetical protein
LEDLLAVTLLEVTLITTEAAAAAELVELVETALMHQVETAALHTTPICLATIYLMLGEEEALDITAVQEASSIPQHFLDTDLAEDQGDIIIIQAEEAMHHIEQTKELS